MSIYTKLLEVQKEIGAIKKEETNPFFKSKYFDINGLLAVVKPVLNKHGLVLLQGLTNVQGGWVSGEGSKPVEVKLGITTVIVDSEEENSKIEFTCPLPESGDSQKYGSSITYFRRYALQSLLALEAEDDDANDASDRGYKAYGAIVEKPITKKDNFKI